MDGRDPWDQLRVVVLPNHPPGNEAQLGLSSMGNKESSSSFGWFIATLKSEKEITSF